MLVATITYHGFTGGEDNSTYGAVVTATRYIAYLLAFLLFAARPTKAIRIKNTPPFLILGAYFFFSILWSQNLNIVIINIVHFVGTGLSAFLAAQFFLSNDNPLTKVYWPALFFFIMSLSLIIVVLFPEYNSNADSVTGIDSDQGRRAGITGSPNTLGVECVIAIWVAVSGFFSSPGKKTKLLLIALGLMSIILLLGTQSASSLVTTVVAVALIVFLTKYSAVSKEKRKKILMGLSYFLAIISILLLFILPNIVSIESSTQALGKDSTFTGRTEIWSNAKTLIARKPILGWGFDNNTAVKDEVWMPFNHFHNGYLDIMVRGGIIGFGIIVFMYIWYIYKLLAMDSATFRRNIPGISIALATLVYNIGEVTFASSTHALWIVMLFSLFMVTAEKTRRRKKARSFQYAFPKRKRKRRRRKRSIQSPT